MKTYKGMAIDKETNEPIILEMEYKTKKDFISDVRSNGYSINELRVKESNVYNYIMDNTNATDDDFRNIKNVGDDTASFNYTK